MILVTGCTGYVAGFLLRELARQDESVRCLVRPHKPEESLRPLREWGMSIQEGDLLDERARRRALEGVRAVIHLAHIRYAPLVLSDAGTQVERLVLMSSLWRFSRVVAAGVTEVINAEKAVEKCDKPWVLLRPSMIYGPGSDRNISRLRAQLRRWRVMPIFGSGQALHQPVYVGDVVRATMAALRQPGIEHRSYALAGRSALSYRDLLTALGHSIGVSPIIVPLPARPAAALVGILRRWGAPLPLEPEQILRLQEDKQYDIGEAQRDLAYEPVAFERGLELVGAGGGHAEN